MVNQNTTVNIQHHTERISHVRTNRQVEIVLFKRTEAGIRFLMLKRNPQKGGFWQPITGGVHEGETDTNAAIREVREETGVEAKTPLVDTGHSFTFEEEPKTYYEHVFGLEIDEQTNVVLSPEHTELAWVSKQEALDSYLKWPGNKQGLEALARIVGD